ncbi:hypothetical protein VZT92_017273 [Zoarces viviparus]|uniref:AIG1-type G domain-containing protein n=1 Tax=Zoarces viviparus TaxID=48416 RepID=A0AAW1ERM1_ZOAVI
MFGENLFKINHTLNSETSKCRAETRSVSGRNITVIDTPGLFDTHRSEEEMKSEIVKCFTEFAPGLHAFLIVLKVEKFTDHEQAVITKINQLFSEEAFKYATVLFTHGEQLPEGQNIYEFVRDNKLVSDLVEKCGGRCHVIDNKYWKNNQQDEYRSNQFQVKEILKTTEKMIEENNGSCYTNEMLQVVEAGIKQDEERIRQSSGDMSEEEIREKAKDKVFKRLLINLAVSNRRIVILGKTGVGKSSVANTMFGEERFKIGNTVNSETSKCRAETSVDGRDITVIDTPGLFDTDRPEEDLKSEIVKCIIEFSPGPHAFLIMFKVERFTDQEQAVITKINQYFSEEVFKYATVLFTHGDQLKEQQTIEDFVRDNKLVSDLVKKCGGRCHVIDNKYWKNNQQDEYRSNQFQVKELLNTIDQMIEANKGSYYTNETLQAVEAEIRQEEEHIRQSPGDMSEIAIREKAKDKVSESLWSKLSGLSAVSNRRIFILGRTGVGKGSAANTIFGEERFTIGQTLNSETSECRAETKSVDGRNITVIDTPGLFDTDRPEEELNSEIVKCITEFAPGPHAFLIVFKVERFTDQEQAVITKINQYFSEEVFKYATVLFTHGDQLKEGQTIKDFIRDNKLVSDLVEKCGGRCHVIDNKYWKNNQQDEYRSNQFQVKQLLNTIEKMIEENNGSCYTNETLQAVEAGIRQEEEHIRQSSGNMSEEEIREKAKDTVYKWLLSKLTAETKSVNGRGITLIDTPGFFDPGRSEEKMNPELLKCIAECAPGPHALLIVLKVEKFTEQEKAVVTQICKDFSENALKYAVIVFTHGDQLPEGMKMEKYVEQSKGLSDLVKKCGGRCHVVDNKYWKNNNEDYRSNQFQVAELLDTIDEIVTENNGGFYTDEKLQQVEEDIQEEEERMRRSSGNKSQEEIRKQARSNVFKKQADDAAPTWRRGSWGVVIIAGLFAIVSAMLINSKSVKVSEQASVFNEQLSAPELVEVVVEQAGTALGASPPETPPTTAGGVVEVILTPVRVIQKTFEVIMEQIYALYERTYDPWNPFE